MSKLSKSSKLSKLSKSVGKCRNCRNEGPDLQRGGFSINPVQMGVLDPQIRVPHTYGFRELSREFREILKDCRSNRRNCRNSRNGVSNPYYTRARVYREALLQEGMCSLSAKGKSLSKYVQIGHILKDPRSNGGDSQGLPFGGSDLGYRAQDQIRYGTYFGIHLQIRHT